MTDSTTHSRMNPVGSAAAMEVGTLEELVRAASGDRRSIRVVPGTYRMSDYLTPDVLLKNLSWMDPKASRPPVAMLMIRGNMNTIDCSGVTLEIETELFAKMPPHGYTRCLTITGNALRGRTTGSALIPTGIPPPCLPFPYIWDSACPSTVK